MDCKQDLNKVIHLHTRPKTMSRHTAVYVQIQKKKKSNFKMAQFCHYVHFILLEVDLASQSEAPALLLLYYT